MNSASRIARSSGLSASFLMASFLAAERTATPGDPEPHGFTTADALSAPPILTLLNLGLIVVCALYARKHCGIFAPRRHHITCIKNQTSLPHIKENHPCPSPTS